jgi:hypothetical protein
LRILDFGFKGKGFQLRVLDFGFGKILLPSELAFHSAGLRSSRRDRKEIEFSFGFWLRGRHPSSNETVGYVYLIYSFPKNN